MEGRTKKPCFPERVSGSRGALVLKTRSGKSRTRWQRAESGLVLNLVMRFDVARAVGDAAFECSADGESVEAIDCPWLRGFHAPWKA